MKTGIQSPEYLYNKIFVNESIKDPLPISVKNILSEIDIAKQTSARSHGSWPSQTFETKLDSPVYFCANALTQSATARNGSQEI
jgi:hypothetical protein